MSVYVSYRTNLRNVFQRLQFGLRINLDKQLISWATIYLQKAWRGFSQLQFPRIEILHWSHVLQFQILAFTCYNPPSNLQVATEGDKRHGLECRTGQIFATHGFPRILVTDHCKGILEHLPPCNQWLGREHG